MDPLYVAYGSTPCLPRLRHRVPGGRLVGPACLQLSPDPGEPDARALGSYLVQELRRMGRREGLIPAARCDPANEASHRTLLRGGFVECGRIVAGRLAGTGDAQEPPALPGAPRP